MSKKQLMILICNWISKNENLLLKEMEKIRIAVFSNYSKENTTICLNKVIELVNRSSDLSLSLIGDASNDTNKLHYFKTNQEISDNCDIFLAIGGDGTIIDTAKYAVNRDLPLIGINAGRVGFLASLDPEQIDLLPTLLAGNGRIESRRLIKATIRGVEDCFYALNEFVISGSVTILTDYFISIDDTDSYHYRADGIIVASPTGSTAYSLSAGGPVVDPELNCMILTPICPHSFFNRSVIFGNEKTVTIRVPDDVSTEIRLSSDGDIIYKLSSSNLIDLSVSDKSLKLIKLKDNSFFDSVNKTFLKK
jgi:NAD+ kinase